MGQRLPVPGRGRIPTDPQVVAELIELARKHRLGTEFLTEGALDAVSATFGAHAFTVEEARRKLGN